MTCRKCLTELPIIAFPEYRPGCRRRVCQSCINRRRSARRAEGPNSADRVRGRQRDVDVDRERLRVYAQSLEGRQARKRKPSRQPVAVNAENRARRARNRAKARETSRRHMRLRRLGYDRPLSAWVEVLVADPCAYCGGGSTGVDHITPVARGGANEAQNFVGACFGCNREKRATPLLAYLLRMVA